MGNCILKDQSTHWGGEDWGSFDDHGKLDHYSSVQRDNRRSIITDTTTDHNLLGSGRLREEDYVDHNSADNNNKLYLSSSSRGTHHEMIKIKISKKQLEQIMKKNSGLVQGLSLEQVLAQSVMNGDDRLEQVDHRRQWRPVLESIPE